MVPSYEWRLIRWQSKNDRNIIADVIYTYVNEDRRVIIEIDNFMSVFSFCSCCDAYFVERAMSVIEQDSFIISINVRVTPAPPEAII